MKLMSLNEIGMSVGGALNWTPALPKAMPILCLETLNMFSQDMQPPALSSPFCWTLCVQEGKPSPTERHTKAPSIGPTCQDS